MSNSGELKYFDVLEIAKLEVADGVHMQLNSYIGGREGSVWANVMAALVIENDIESLDKLLRYMTKELPADYCSLHLRMSMTPKQWSFCRHLQSMSQNTQEGFFNIFENTFPEELKVRMNEDYPYVKSYFSKREMAKELRNKGKSHNKKII